MKLTSQFLLTALPQASFLYGNKVISTDSDWDTINSISHTTVSIDSRSLTAGDFFIPLAGERFDGHIFIEHALQIGACGALIAKKHRNIITTLPTEITNNRLFIIVDDVLTAFIALAKTWRNYFTCPVIGITGSVGKTTTKEMLRSILIVANIKAYVSIKSYNNIFGLCYSILQIPEDVAVIVQEVGINEEGEMIQLADILRPTIGVITCIGHAHLAGFNDSLQKLAYEKRQLFAFFDSSNVGIIFGDQTLLTDISYTHPIARFGLKTKNQVQARKVSINTDSGNFFNTSFIFKWYNHKAHVLMNGNHVGFVNNALAASTVAYFLAISFDLVVKGIETYQGMQNRFQMRPIKNNKGLILDDCYNANPESMKAAITAFSQFNALGEKIAVLGDMLELGQKEQYWHRQIGRLIRKIGGIEKLILVGPLAHIIANTLPDNVAVFFAIDWSDACNQLKNYIEQKNSVMVLIKASSGMQLKQIVQELAI